MRFIAASLSFSLIPNWVIFLCLCKAIDSMLDATEKAVIIYPSLDGLVAQLVERPAHNRAVGGSTPPEPTKESGDKIPAFRLFTLSVKISMG